VRAVQSRPFLGQAALAAEELTRANEQLSELVLDWKDRMRHQQVCTDATCPCPPCLCFFFTYCGGVRVCVVSSRPVWNQ